MSYIAAMVTELSFSIAVDALAKNRLLYYERLSTGHDNGRVYCDARTTALVLGGAGDEVGSEILTALVARIKRWSGEVRANQNIVTEARPDLPLELASSIVPTPDGIDYKLEMATLDQIIQWDQDADTVTLQPYGAWDITLEAFLYYIGTLEDLVAAIALARG